MKTADVRTIAIERVGGGYLAAAVQGRLAAVRAAVEAGSTAVKRYGELRAAQVYPKPHHQAVALLEGATNQGYRTAIAALEPGATP
jgi:microcompartment protein CcmL/EutN